MIKVKLDLLIDIDVLLMVDIIRRGIRHFIHRYAKANDKRKIMIKIKNRHIFNIGM